ncbi:MAG: hypothetical protein K0S79_110 [Nitrospira sp.]|nr:hypothetical protein [Nitrospira sp.]
MGPAAKIKTSDRIFWRNSEATIIGGRGESSYAQDGAGLNYVEGDPA